MKKNILDKCNAKHKGLYHTKQQLEREKGYMGRFQIGACIVSQKKLTRRDKFRFLLNVIIKMNGTLLYYHQLS